MPGAIPNLANSTGRFFDARRRLNPSLAPMAGGLPPLPLSAGMDPSLMGRKVPGRGLPLLSPLHGRAEILGGGSSGGFEGMGHQAPIDAHAYGDSFADVSHGAGPYTGIDELSAMNADRPQLTSWGEERPPSVYGGAVTVARGHGGPVAPGQPFIAGDDPKGKGKENREMILPMPDGSIHVIPVKKGKGLPKLGTGTIDPKLGKANLVSDHGETDAFALARPFEGRMEAFDQEGQLLGYSEGLSTPQPVVAAPVGPPPAWREEQARKAEAIARAGNPLNIIPGVTPRPALTRPEAMSGGPSREERTFDRLERNVMREARRNPRLALELMGGKAQTESERARAEFAERVHNDLVTHQGAEAQRKADAARGYVSAGPGQPMMPTLEARRFETDSELRSLKEAREIAEFEQRQRPPEFVPIANSGGGVIMQGNRQGSGFIRPPGAPEAEMVKFPGTDIAVPTINGRQVSGVPAMQMTSPGRPAQGPPLLPQFQRPEQPPQFQPMPQPKEVSAAKREEMRTISQHFDEMNKIIEKITLSELPDGDDRKLPMDDATRADLKRWRKFHKDAYEKAYGIPGEAKKLVLTDGAGIYRPGKPDVSTGDEVEYIRDSDDGTDTVYVRTPYGEEVKIARRFLTEPGQKPPPVKKPSAAFVKSVE